ncbi:peptide deformylase [soil metagenome]
MSVREIRYLGDPVLRQEAQPVSEMTEDIRRLIEDMFDTMYAEDGVGLAAPQVGVSQRVIVVDAREPEQPPFALINPVILEVAGEIERDEEGCLSIPGLKEIVERPAIVRVEGTNRDGERVVMEADGLLARVLQHEIDHLNGVLFIDRVSPLKRKLLLSRWQKVRP